MKIFVYSNYEIALDDVIIPQFGVGIVSNEDNNYYFINFVVGNKTIKIIKNDVTIFDPLKVGDSFQNKVCNVCHRFLPTSEFSKNQNGKNNRTIRRPYCEECRKVIDGINLSPKDRKEFEKIKPHLEIFTCPICKKRQFQD